MSQVITAREAQERFNEVLQRANAGESFVVTDGGEPKASIQPPAAEAPARKTPQPGCMKGLVKYMSDDFNDPLPEFEDY